MKYFVTFSLLAALIFPCFAQEAYLSDVPEGHYAYDAVYDLIQRGITGGFPDGTYRGNKNMTRFDIAAFISKFARSFKVAQATDEKMVAELRSEVSLIKHQKEKEDKELIVSGNLETRWRYGRTETIRGTQADYRLKTSLIKKFGTESERFMVGIKIGLDTMDAGFNNANRDLVRELLDLEGKVRIGAVTLKATSGPGDVAHVEDGLFPIENNMKYLRPRRTISITSTAKRSEISIEHLSRSTQSSGLLGTNEVSAKLVQNYAPLKITYNPRYFYNTNSDNNWRMDLALEYKPNEVFSGGLLIGVAQGAEPPHGLYLRGDFSIGEEIKILAQRIGSQYRAKFTYSIFDMFDRDLADGVTNFGLELKKDFDKTWRVKLKGDYTDPGEVLTGELRLGRYLSADAILELVYQTYKAQSSSQALGVSASFKI